MRLVEASFWAWLQHKVGVALNFRALRVPMPLNSTINKFLGVGALRSSITVTEFKKKPIVIYTDFYAIVSLFNTSVNHM